jgi:hypothetical protein
LKVPHAEGVATVIPGTEAVIGRLDKLDAFVADLGPAIPFDKAERVKQVWDRIVSRSGLYTNKATASATDNAAAWATREAAAPFRELLASGSPSLAKLNQEYRFWKGLRTVLHETTRRTQAQSGGLISAGMGGAGAIIGGLSGDSMTDRIEKAALGGLVGRQFIRVMQSPAWRTSVSAPAKQALADALASGSAERITRAASRIVAAVPSLVTQDTGPLAPSE